VVNVQMMLSIYLGGGLLVALGVYAAGRRLGDRRSPARHPMVVSAIAGAVWPLLIVGLVELSSLVVFTRVQSKPGSGIGTFR
jgi:hypothetical protein